MESGFANRHFVKGRKTRLKGRGDLSSLGKTGPVSDSIDLLIAQQAFLYGGEPICKKFRKIGA